MYVCLHVCVYVCLHVCVYVCLHACMYLLRVYLSAFLNISVFIIVYLSERRRAGICACLLVCQSVFLPKYKPECY